MSSFVAWSKIGHDFTICSGFKIEVPEKSFKKKDVLLRSYSLMKKKIRKIQMIFDIENHFESPISALCDKRAKLGKASQDA